MYLTEKEILVQNQHFAYKLRKLYLEDETVFHQLNDYLPYSIHINNKDTLDITYANSFLLNKGQEMEKLAEIGGSYLKEISCPILLQNAVQRTNRFNSINDYNGIVFIAQNIKVNKKFSYLFSNKLHLNENQYFNVANFACDMGGIGKVLTSIFEGLQENQVGFQQFQSLTKQEKIILNLIVTGYTYNEIANQLCISSHTVLTHRKNIYKKTNSKTLADLIRFAMALELTT
ncbi:MAG: helix-turn-helix transcriptional regulator [Flavobacterium sp.]|nr:helix-turn-helix transcriptional regulator [Flavobacterium sp.]